MLFIAVCIIKTVTILHFKYYSGHFIYCITELQSLRNIGRKDSEEINGPIAPVGNPCLDM